jgi:hypothetical protein
MKKTTLHRESHLSYIDNSGPCAEDMQTATRTLLRPEISELLGVKQLQQRKQDSLES